MTDIYSIFLPCDGISNDSFCRFPLKWIFPFHLEHTSTRNGQVFSLILCASWISNLLLSENSCMRRKWYWKIPNAHFLLFLACNDCTERNTNFVKVKKINVKRKIGNYHQWSIFVVFDFSFWQIRCHLKPVYTPCSGKIVILSFNCWGYFKADCDKKGFSFFFE